VTLGPDKTKETDAKANVQVTDGIVVRVGSKKVVKVPLG
jgi:hypothetical protein